MSAMNQYRYGESWYEKSCRIIHAQLAEVKHLETKDQKRHCSKNYPYRERRGWAYQAWLKAMRDIFHPEKKTDKRRRRKAERIYNEDQLEMNL